MDGGRPDETDPWDLIEGDGPDVALALTSLVDWIAEQDRLRILDNRVLEDLYSGRWVNSDDLSPGVMAYRDAGGDAVKLNFARNAVDFVHTKVCAETPSVVASAREGGYAQQRRAKDLTKHMDGLADHAKSAEVLPRAALTALRTGTAVVKTFVGPDGKPGIELVPPEWVFVDPAEARCGQPRSLYERRPMTRRSVRTLWGDTDERIVAIDAAGTAEDPLLLIEATAEVTHDLIDVYEAVSLPEIGFDGEQIDGRHVICVRGCVLLDEPYTLPRFRHAFYHLTDTPFGRGFWAQGMLEQMDETQAEIDYLLGRISDQIRLTRLMFFVQQQEDEARGHLRVSGDGSIITYQNTIPQAQTPAVVSRDAIEHIRWLVEQLYSIAGMSEQAATSQRPAGVNSGRAILFFHDFQTRRYVDLVKRYSAFCVDVAERLLDRAAEAAGEAPEVDEDREENDEAPDSIDSPSEWHKVAMDRADYRLELEAVSAVPSSYAGRMQRIEQLIAQGQVPEGYWSQYLSDPDAWRAENRAATQSDYIEWLLELLHETGKQMPPLSDRLDFDLALEVLTGEILTLERTEGTPEAVLDRADKLFDSITARRKELLELQLRQQAATGVGAPAPQTAGVAPTLAPMGVGGLGPTTPQ